MSAPARGTERGAGPRVRDAQALLAFEAPYLVDKLCKDQVATREGAVALLRELLRWMLLSTAPGAKKYDMYSRRVDEVWHQFVLFTTEYTAFCDAMFGGYLHHAPRGAPSLEGDARPAATFEGFARDYEGRFGPLPAEWHDVRAIGEHTRLLRERFRRPLGVRVEGERASLVIERDVPYVFVATEARAAPALRFIAGHTAFYVRELPGELRGDERIALCRALAELEVVRVAAA